MLKFELSMFKEEQAIVTKKDMPRPNEKYKGWLKNIWFFCELLIKTP